jgi:hypothetical protein
MKRYAIWNKTDPVITPVGVVLTAEQWIQRYPVAGVPTITVICAGGEINGGFFGTLGQMTDLYEKEGCVFTDDMTAEEKLAAIEAFEDEREATAKAQSEEKAAADAMNAEMNAMSLASIAAQLEFQNMMALPDEEV